MVVFHAELGMSLVSGYSSGSDEESDRNKRPSDANLDFEQSKLLDKPASMPVEKTVTGDMQHIKIDATSFKRRKRFFEESRISNAEFKNDSKTIKKTRKGSGDPYNYASYLGPWAGYDNDDSSSSEEIEDSKENLKNFSVPKEDDAKDYRKAAETETTELFEKKQVPILHPPSQSKIDFNGTPGEQKCYVPRKVIFTYHAHENGVQMLQFLPKTGHLILSSGNDNNIKIWEVYGRHKLLRGYYGHTKPVNYINFSQDGTKFISCSYDKYVKIWDTEKGTCINKLKLRSYPTVAKFNPKKNNEFLIGNAKANIEHYDLNSNDIVQSYESHRGAINDMIFINDGTNLVTSSADKTIKIWNLGVNMPIKEIKGTKQQSMPSLQMHPSGKYFCAQSMDNTIVTFTTKKNDKFKRIRKKTFTGHHSAGYAIDIQFTPDGRSLASGDAFGFTYFWDWKTTKLIKKIKTDDQPITKIDTHPLESSMMAMAGSTGKIFLYD